MDIRKVNERMLNIIVYSSWMRIRFLKISKELFTVVDMSTGFCKWYYVIVLEVVRFSDICLGRERALKGERV